VGVGDVDERRRGGQRRKSLPPRRSSSFPVACLLAHRDTSPPTNTTSRYTHMTSPLSIPTRRQSLEAGVSGSPPIVSPFLRAATLSGSTSSLPEPFSLGASWEGSSLRVSSSLSPGPTALPIASSSDSSPSLPPKRKEKKVLNRSIDISRFSLSRRYLVRCKRAVAECIVFVMWISCGDT